MSENILEVKNLKVSFRTDSGDKVVVQNVNFSVKKGENVAIVGESGSGKSVTNLSILGLNDNANISGEILFYGQDLLKFSHKQLQSIRGNKIAMIFQDPMTSLNPFLKNVHQIMEPLLVHKGMKKSQAKERALELLDLVGIKEARKSLDQYPHHFSGGMRQRVMIAIALSCNPDLLIADEPTTALDVTVQAQILNLIEDLRRKLNMSVILVTHNLGIVAGMADKVVVMNQGSIVEQGNVDDIFYNTKHEYTKGLIRSIPRLEQDKNEPLYSMSSNEEYEEVLQGDKKVGKGFFRQFFCRALKNKKVIFGFATFIVYILLIFSPKFLLIYSYTDQYPVHRNLRPSMQTAGNIMYQNENRLIKKQAKIKNRQLTISEKLKLESIKRDIDADSFSQRRYILGTDNLGRDMLARLIYASCISIFIGISGTLVSLVLGVIVGALSGYIGGRMDRFIMAAVEVLYSLPSILLVVLLMTIIGGSDIINLFIAISLLSWLVEARLVRGQILSLKNFEFIEAARSMGASTGKIVFKHLIPNMMDIIIVFATVRIPSFILAESFLSFLGIGISAPLASWGVLIKDGVQSMELYPWQLFLPAFMMALFLFGVNFLGDGLRDCFDIKEKMGQKIL